MPPALQSRRARAIPPPTALAKERLARREVYQSCERGAGHHRQFHTAWCNLGSQDTQHGGMRSADLISSLKFLCPFRHFSAACQKARVRNLVAVVAVHRYSSVGFWPRSCVPAELARSLVSSGPSLLEALRHPLFLPRSPLVSPVCTFPALGWPHSC